MERADEAFTPEQIAAYRVQIEPLLEQRLTPQKLMDITHNRLLRLLVEQRPGVAFDQDPVWCRLRQLKKILAAVFPELSGYEPQSDAKLDTLLRKSIDRAASMHPRAS